MRLVWSRPGTAESLAVGSWVASRIPHARRGWGSDVATLRVVDGERVLGAVIFHDYSPETGVIEMSAAADDPRWLSRRTLAEIHDYTFCRANCQMVVMRTPENNARMRRIGKAFGYSEVMIPNLMGRGQAASILTLTDTAWQASRFHKGAKHG